MEQKSKASKRTTTRKGSSSNTTTPNKTTATTLRYSLRNRKESLPAATTSAAAATHTSSTTRSQKRKLEPGQQAQTLIDKQKKPKMEHSNTTSSKGKQKAEIKTTPKKMKQDDALDNYNNDNHDDEVQADEDDDELDPMQFDDSQQQQEEEDDDDASSTCSHNQDDEDDDEGEDENEDDPLEQDEGDQQDQQDEEDDDDDDDDDEESEMSRVRRTLGLHMQGLFGGMMSSDFGRFKSILASLKNNDDPTMQLIALQELAEILSVSSEDNLAGYFSSDSFARELVRIMKGPDDMLSQMGATGDDANMDQDMMLALAMSEGLSGGNPEVMLLACRCISNLLEAMPTAVTSIVSHGAIKVLCQKLKSIQYIDLAEQALYALEKIAAQLPRAVVHEGGLGAALMYFDFFSIHAQRTALRTASNCMRGIDIDSFPQVMEVVPTLMNTMTYSDRSVIELSCLCWVRIAESYRSNKECLERAISVDLLRVLYGLLPIPGNANAVHPGTCQDVLRIFRSIAKASPQLGFELLKLNMIQGLCHILMGSTATPQPHHITLDSKWRDSIPTIMKIIVDLLPPLPKDDMFSTRRFRSVASRTRSSASEAPAVVDARITWFNQHPEVMLELDAILFPLVLDIYASTVNLRVRQLVTHTCVKLLQFSNADTLNEVLEDVSLSSFLSGILTRQEHPVLLMDALYQTELLIKKLPKVYPFLFEREGVLHEIESISKLPLEDIASVKPATAAADQSVASTQPSQENTTVDESDDTTTDADKQVDKATKEEEDEDDDDEEEESENDVHTKSTPGSSSTATTSKPAQQQQQQQRGRMLDNHGLQAMMRNHQLLQQQQQQQHRHRHHAMENEKGVGRGSTRKYIIQLAQHFVNNYFYQQQESRGSSLKEILQFTHAILHPTDDDPASEKALMRLSCYLRDSIMGISSFELINSGLMKALLTYLTSQQDDNSTLKASLQDRVEAFERIFVQQPDIDTEGNNALKKLVVRLQEILSRFESFEVVTPLESTANDSLRNPTSMLAKQLRLRLSGTSDDIPSSFKQLMVSTHAVATFRVLEDYLLARISAASILCDMEDDPNDEQDQDDEEDDDEERVMIDRDGMDIDTEEEDPLDTIMTETVVVDKEEEETDQEEPTSSTSKATTSNSSASASTTTTNNKKEKKDGEYKIRFSMNGTTISNDSTVYAAVHQHEVSTGNTLLIGRNMWASSHPISFERVWVRHSEQDPKAAVVSQLEDIARPKELKEDSTCYQVLLLLKALSPAIAKRTNGITPQDFVNRKLTAKANRQLEEPLIVASSCLPTWLYWLMSETPFLFPFETRYLFIQSTSFGYARLIARWQSLQMRNNTQNGPRNDTADQQPVLGRMERQKVRIMRTQMLESAVKILDLFGSSPTVLEIEYMGEEGTGMGPTLEFYAATSKEFSKHSLNMWRGSHKADKGHVDAPFGLFPKTCVKPTSRSAKKVNQLFKTLGQFIAKGLLDFRILDIPFNLAFFKVALDHVQPSPALLMEIDPQLAKSIRMLTSYVEQKRAIYQDENKTPAQKSAEAKHIQVDGAKLEDLCLDFTLPGDSSYELKTGGADIPVTINNVEEYIDLLQDAIAGSGIAQQINAFREGFNGLFAIDDLKLLTHAELVSLFGKASEDWSYTTLANTIRADHGFTMESEPVRFLLEILSNFTDVEKRQFLQFTTGSPRLPIGGWKALRPVFTVVCKIPEAPLTPDDYLPSVMTCANYFKMPAYSTKEIMLERLLTSMKEGQNSFLLS